MKTDRTSRTAHSNANGKATNKVTDKPTNRPRNSETASARKTPSRKTQENGSPRRHLTTFLDITPDEVEQILSISADLKERTKRGDRPPLLQGAWSR